MAPAYQDGAIGDTRHRVLTSLWALLWGFVFGSVAGMLTGVALARSAWLRAFLEPIVETFRFIVPFSLVPLGSGRRVLAGKVFVVAYATYFVVAINTAGAIQGIDPLVLKAAAMLGLTGWPLLLETCCQPRCSAS